MPAPAAALATGGYVVDDAITLVVDVFQMPEVPAVQGVPAVQEMPEEEGIPEMPMPDD